MEFDGKDNKVETRIGPVWVCPTQKDHVVVRLDHETTHNQVEPNNTPLKVRGTAYRGSFHMFLWSDGYWHVGREYTEQSQPTSLRLNSVMQRKTTEYEQRRDMYIVRRDNREDATRAAKESICMFVQPAVNRWVADHPFAMFLAEAETLQENLTRCDRKVTEAHKELAERRGEQQEASRALRDHLDSVQMYRENHQLIKDAK